jgi:dTDP-4-amino-4,6-dideoxygalactose transaminase
LVSEDEIRAVEAYMRTGKMGRYGYPDVVEQFENLFKKYNAVDYALAVNSGTSALHAAYYALGIGPGDEVLVPTFTFPSTATPLFVLGATPILCDCLRDTVTIDPEDIRRKISTSTKAIAITHLWGHPCEMDEIMEIADRYKVPVLEDCSHAQGAKYKGRKVGTFGKVACMSCDNNKILASGEGGVLLTNSQEIYERSIIFSDFGGRVKLELKLPEASKFKETGLGLKYRIHPLAAVIANEKLKRLDELNYNRVSTLGYLSKRLGSESRSLKAPVTRDYCERGGFYGYKPIYDPQPLNGLNMDTFIRTLQAEGVDIRRTVSPPLHRMELFKDSVNYGVAINREYRGRIIVYRPEDFPNSEWFQNNHVSFPTFSNEEDKEIIDEYISAIKKVEKAVIERPEICKEIDK